MNGAACLGVILAVGSHWDLDFRLYIVGHYGPFGSSLGVCTVCHEGVPSTSLFHHLTYYSAIPVTRLRSFT